MSARDSDGAAAAKSDSASSVDDAKAWQGHWRLVFATWRGHIDAMDGGWSVTGDRNEVVLDGKTIENWKFTLDKAAKHLVALATMGPKGTHEDFLTTTGNKARDGTWSGRIKGIYEVGQGSPRVTFDAVFRRSPSSFDVNASSRFIAYFFERPPFRARRRE